MYQLAIATYQGSQILVLKMTTTYSFSWVYRATGPGSADLSQACSCICDLPWPTGPKWPGLWQPGSPSVAPSLPASQLRHVSRWKYYCTVKRHNPFSSSAWVKVLLSHWPKLVTRLSWNLGSWEVTTEGTGCREAIHRAINTIELLQRPAQDLLQAEMTGGPTLWNPSCREPMLWVGYWWLQPPLQQAQPGDKEVQSFCCRSKREAALAVISHLLTSPGAPGLPGEWKDWEEGREESKYLRKLERLEFSAVNWS